MLNPGASATGAMTSACTTGGEFSETYVDYHVTLTAGERYLFTVRSETPWKPALYLVAPYGGRTPGWSDLETGTGAHSELLFVSPSSGPMTLHIVAATQALGRYTITSQQCGGSSEEIFTHASVGAEATISPSDCVVHDRYLPSDSTHIDSYVLYLDREESKTVTVTARGASVGIFHPAIIASGPYVSGESTAFQHTVASSDQSTLTVELKAGNQAGRYILAVGGASAEHFGDYTLTVGPTAP